MRALCVAAGALVPLTPAHAAAAALPPALAACRAEVDDQTRLRCYDGAVDRIDAAATGRATPSARQGALVGPAAEPLPPPVPAPAPAAQAPSQGNATLPMFRAKIVAMRFRRAGEFVITLDNGQVWTQFVTEGKPRIGVGDTVLIRPGFMGAYILKGPTDWITKVHPLATEPDS